MDTIIDRLQDYTAQNPNAAILFDEAHSKGIFLISVGLLMITYRVYCRKVDSFYTRQAQRAADAAAEDLSSYRYVRHLWEMINTDEFRAVRERAVAENDAQIIRDWMRENPSADCEMVSGFNIEDTEGTGSLYDDYVILEQLLLRTKELFDISSVYIQYDLDGVTYNLADPDEDLLVVGSVETPIKAFSEYGDNERIPPTVCLYGEATLNRMGAASPREILEGVKADVGRFADGAEQFDDLTMLCVVYNGRESA